MSKDSLEKIIDTYAETIKPLDSDARQAESKKESSYGGYIRSAKGELVENLTERLVKLAWSEIGGKLEELKFKSQKIKIPINKEYVGAIEDEEIKEYLNKNIDNYNFKLSVDRHIYIRDKFVMGVECKSYAENAMLKKIATDFYLLQEKYPNLLCYLLQLESQLGGDYSELNEIAYGSKSTHAILSYFFPMKLNIITLLEGERKIKKPIHKPEHYKPLEKKHLKVALETFKNALKPFVKTQTSE